MYSLLIKNATLLDGTGQRGEMMDLVAQGDQIVNIAKNITLPAETIIDAAGKILAPGFVDIQNHSDSYWQLFDNPSLDSLISQGFTTILVGNCGASLAPLLSHEALKAIQKWHNLESVNIDWRTFAEYAAQLSKSRLACNVASLVGYSTLRRAIVGDQIRGLEKAEMEALKEALRQSLNEGAFGLSSGLSYAHEIIISELELFELAKIVAEKQALLSIHLRNEGSEVVEAVDEALDIAKNTGVNLKISHLKIRGQANWPKFDQVVEQINTAFHKGTNVHFDVYPYDTIWQVLYAYLPKWGIEGGRTVMLKHFADKAQKNKILTYLNNSGVNFQGMIVASTSSKLSFVGKTVGQVAKNLETTSEQAVLYIVEHGGSEVLVFEKNLDAGQVRQLCEHPLSIIATDGAGFSLNLKSELVHPRCFGTAAKFLSESQSGELKLEQAVQKLTSAPAKKIGLQKRGELKVGNFADLVIFDAKKIKDKAGYENPYQFSEGVDYVFVNGQAAVKEGKLTGQLAGRTLKKS